MPVYLAANCTPCGERIGDPGVPSGTFARILREELLWAVEGVEELSRPPPDYKCLDYLESWCAYPRGFRSRFPRVIAFEGVPAAKPVLETEDVLRA